MPLQSIRGEKMHAQGRKLFEPFDPNDDPHSEEWEGEDPTDVCIPDMPGFITDYVLLHRGREGATAYSVWGALYMLSSVLQREAYMSTGGGDYILDRDWFNLYLLFIGPAGCGKSRALTAVQKIIKAANAKFKEDPNPHYQNKNCMFIADASTPEAMLHSMASFTMAEEPGQRKMLMGNNPGGDVMQVEMTTNVNAIISEFASLLGKSKYLESMSTHLLALYDCPSVYDWSTRHSGNLAIPEVYFNLLGASTADGMMSAVSPAIMQDGFMSRMIMVNVDGYTRSRAIRYETICKRDDIVERLVAIAKNNDGAFYLSREATEYYKLWYDDFMVGMNSNSEKAGYMIRNRGLILKIAALMKVSEYTTGNQIDVKHLKAAEQLITWTYSGVSEMIGYMTDKQVGAAMKAIIKYTSAEKGGVTRRQVARRLNRFSPETVNNAIYSLYLQGEIHVITETGEVVETTPSFYPQERYEYERVKRDPTGFKPKPTRTVPKASEGPVYESGSGIDDSDLDEEESVGNILSFAGIGD